MPGKCLQTVPSIAGLACQDELKASPLVYHTVASTIPIPIPALLNMHGPVFKGLSFVEML